MTYGRTTSGYPILQIGVLPNGRPYRIYQEEDGTCFMQEYTKTLINNSRIEEKWETVCVFSEGKN